MALFQPTLVVPDVRSGLGYGTIDAKRTWNVSWRVNGASAMIAYQIEVRENTTASGLVYSTGRITDGCPFFGTTPTGDVKTFSHTMPAIVSMYNGSSYKLVITQWWGANESITQNSASVFYTRETPNLSIAQIGTVTSKEYTFIGNYSQADGDVLNWFRWEVAAADNLSEPLYDSGNVSGTMDIQCTFDGFFTGLQYAVRLTAQTQSGVSCDSGWQLFDVQYGTPVESDEVTAECVTGTNAVLVSWSGEGANGLVTPSQSGSMAYTGSPQTPTFLNYDPNTMTIGGVTSATDAGTYTATFTPKAGYSWGGGVSSVLYWSIYRKDSGNQFAHLADVPPEKGQLYDYSAASRQGPYTYYAFPIGADGIMGAPLQSNSVTPCYYSWSLMECQRDGDRYNVVAEYLFKYNFTSGAMSNNNKPSVERNFTKYPTIFKVPQNYRSGSLSTLIGTVDYDNNATYSDTLSMRQRLFALSTTKNDLFLKSRKGDVIHVSVSDAISAQVADATVSQAQTVSISWVEIGAVSNLLKLTALYNAASTDNVNSPNLTLDPDNVAVSVGASFTINATWEGNGVLSASPGSDATVSINNRVITVTKQTSGKTVIPISVSASAQYTAQTVPLTVEAIGIPTTIPYLSANLVYSGSEQTPTFLNYNASAASMSGDLSGTNAGSYSTVFTLNYGYVWDDGTLEPKQISWSIAKAPCNLTVTPTSLTIAAGETANFTIEKEGDGEVTVTPADPAVATADVIDTTTATVVPTPSQSNTLKYNGAAQSPTWNNYDSSKMTLGGTTSGTEPGTYGAVFTLEDGYIWDDTPRGYLGTVNGLSSGTTTIHVVVAETANYLGDSADVTVTVTT